MGNATSVLENGMDFQQHISFHTGVPVFSAGGRKTELFLLKASIKQMPWEEELAT